MSGKSINFDNKKIEKSNFYKNKKIFNIYDIDVNKILVSKKEPYGINKEFKDKKTTMSLKVNDKQLFKNYNKIWKEFERLMSIDFDSKPVYDNDDKYIKTKIKTYEGSIKRNFHNKKIPKEKLPCKCLSIIMLDSALNAYKSIILKHF